MLTSDFDYELPEDRIAQEALPRGESRLLVLPTSGGPRHGHIRDLPDLLHPGDLLVVNDTRVIPARLFATRPTGGRVEILLVERRSELEWTALVKPGRRARPGTSLRVDEGLGVRVLAKGRDGCHLLRFDRDVDPLLQRLGHVPLPPYIKRPDRAADRERYQTVWAAHPGAIAAPTAGLHFDDALLAALDERGVEIAPVTLHVGIGTFKPVTATLVHEHVMEAERWSVPAATAAAIARRRSAGGRVVAVGTTVVRTLEAGAAEHGGEVRAGAGATGLFITPGFSFTVVDLLLTNFHLPRSTLLMLVCAFAGRERVLAAYREAIRERYRFYSYGDAMLLERGTRADRSGTAPQADRHQEEDDVDAPGPERRQGRRRPRAGRRERPEEDEEARRSDQVRHPEEPPGAAPAAAAQHEAVAREPAEERGEAVERIEIHRQQARRRDAGEAGQQRHEPAEQARGEQAQLQAHPLRRGLRHRRCGRDTPRRSSGRRCPGRTTRA